MIVRFRYSKLANAVYIGHLEMTKVFERAFRRSGVVVKYTEGFNPTVKLNFASPLSVGIESEYEVAEVEIEDGSFEHFFHLQLPLGIRILEFKQVEKGTPLMSRLAYSSYSLKPIFPPVQNISQPSSSISSSISSSSLFIAERIAWFDKQPEILFEKRTKKGSKTVDMKDFVRDIRHDFLLHADTDEAEDFCAVTLVSGNQGSLNPGILAAVLFPDCNVRIRRVFLSDAEGMGLY